ncbi:SusC/RagA family TonB-linked outer membrane protein [Polaribacter reichenbachii]|uniref:SusC/RagA family TonB-linked outer membrane protein n=2 Tax=Polaribacter reichenbachii TaxID=996801 RepID=A0A1B8TUZ8_9FLAO|nr:SusC/RagA family TonB-linked outer membrane protein [Polaribacter reichenbachii]
MSVSAIYAQKVTVRGVVTGGGEPLPGATVNIKGTRTGTITDFDGNYILEVDKGKTLVFSFLGYASKEVIVANKTTVDVVLAEDASTLDEIVVVGYGTQKRKEVTGAVGQIKNEELALNATADLGTALQGQIAGVTVTAQDGSPGAESNVVIRGVSSIVGSSSPLYVVDGIPFDTDPKLSIDEIETIDVLKDAASAAIYGTRGAGGVILITTKQGKEGVMKMSANTYYGMQQITSGVPLMETEDYLYALHLSKAALNGTYFGETWTSIVNGPHQLTNNSNLVNVVENDFAPIQNHNLSISGGKEGLTYNINASFFNQEGMLINSGYDRFNVRANTQYRKGKWNVSTGIGFRIEERERSPYDLALRAIKNNPYSNQIELELNESGVQNDGQDNDASDTARNLATFLQTDIDYIENLNGNISARFNFNKNLSYTLRGGASYTNNTREKIRPSIVVYNFEGELVQPNTYTRSYVRNESGRYSRFTLEHILNFKKSWGSHNVQATAAYSAQKAERSYFYALRYDIFNNAVTDLGGAISNGDSGSGSVWNNNTQTLLGLLGRVQYNYKGKYLLSGSVRYDGSSQFSEKYRYGTFPSVSLGWNISDENFWSPIKSVANSLKLRASIGTVGNDRFTPYSNAATISLTKDYVTGPETGDVVSSGATQTSFANSEVKWETQVTRNVGFDLGMFKNKLTISGDVYETNKEDLLLPLLLPPTTGAGLNQTVILNVGDLTNRGMEWSANYRHKGKFSWNAGATFTKNKNEVTKMAGANKVLYLSNSTVVQGVPNEDLVSVVAEGYEAGSFFLIKTDGIIKTQEELDAYNPMVGGNANLGDLRYVDALTEDTDGDGVADAGDGVIDLNDRQFAGSGNPAFTVGFNFGARYKGFDLAMQWYGAFNGEIMNGSKAYAYKMGNHQDLVHMWSPANPDSNIPTFRGRDHANARGYTDYWLEDATFVRLKNITLGYTINKKYIEPSGLSKIRLYVSAQNPLTITNYTGYDPEVGTSSLATRGLDRGNYPVSSSFRVGAQFSF